MQSGITSTECEQVHRTLKRIVKARASLDAQEAQALREGRRLGVWRAYGYASMAQYMERELGYTPRAAIERLRVANAIEDLPVIAQKLDQGELTLSAAEELTRVVTPETEGDWVAACADKPVREIERMVAEHHKGDRPTDPPDPTLRRYSLTYRVRPETYALVRQVKQILEREAGDLIDDDAFIATLCRRVIDGASVERKRAPYQIAITTCDTCKRGWQDGGGATVEMSAAALEAANCDAERIGRVDGPRPERAKQDIPPAVRRQVLARDHHQCSVPWCTSSSNLDIHHIERRADGGTHEPAKLCTLCESHHVGHHEGSLLISGTYPDIKYERAWWVNPSGHVRRPSRYYPRG